MKPLNKELQEKQEIDKNIGEDVDFVGLPDFITTMTDGVDKGLIQGFIGVVEESLRLGFPTLLDDDLLNEDGIDIGEGLLDHLIGDDGRSVLDEGIHPQGQMKEIRIIYF